MPEPPHPLTVGTTNASHLPTRPAMAKQPPLVMDPADSANPAAGHAPNDDGTEAATHGRRRPRADIALTRPLTGFAVAEPPQLIVAGVVHVLGAAASGPGQVVRDG